MHEAFPISDADPIQSLEAMRVFGLIVDSMHNHGLTYFQDLADGSYSHFLKDGVCDVIMMYLQSKQIDSHDTSFSPPRIELPLVAFDVVHHGLYHSTIGPVPHFFVGGDGVLYSTSNVFMFNGLGQSYREDKLAVELRSRPMLEEACHIYPRLKITPQATDLGHYINPIKANDYEMIGHYLHQIDEGELRRL